MSEVDDNMACFMEQIIKHCQKLEEAMIVTNIHRSFFFINIFYLLLLLKYIYSLPFYLMFKITRD